ncbi:MAG: putative SOS response-associated peptidase YedK [Phycisphaerales bacterium]|jgi:putative SOS response-associated peptidase YedK
MCGRLSSQFTWPQIHELLSAWGVGLTTHARARPGPTPSYNVAPTESVPVLRAAGPDVPSGEVDSAMLRWWLVPFWSKTPTIKYPTFNARSEDAAGKPTFREPFRTRRCVVPVSGFYEWHKREDGTKQPYYITRADGAPACFAGLWDRWVSQDRSETVESCTILTTTPNAEMRPIHHRMPCVLEPEKVAAWTDPTMQDPEKVREFLGPAADGVLTMRPVSTRVNNARNNGPELLEPGDGGLFDG